MNCLQRCGDIFFFITELSGNETLMSKSIRPSFHVLRQQCGGVQANKSGSHFATSFSTTLYSKDVFGNSCEYEYVGQSGLGSRMRKTKYERDHNTRVLYQHALLVPPNRLA